MERACPAPPGGGVWKSGGWRGRASLSPAGWGSVADGCSERSGFCFVLPAAGNGGGEACLGVR